MTDNKKFAILLLTTIFAASLSGCDAIKGIKEYFSKPKDSKSPAVSQVVPAGQVQGSSAATPSASAMGENVLAQVGTWTITKEEFQDRLNALKEVVPDFDAESPEAKRFVLDELVRQQLLVVSAEQSGMANDKDILNAVEEFRRTLIVRETVRKLTEALEVSDAEALAFYNEQKDLLKKDEEWHIREIVVETEDEAKAIAVRLLSGEDFAEIAKASSKSETAANGGDLGFITEAPFPQMASALLPLEVGGISGVFKGPQGFYIAKLEEKKGGQEIPFEEIKEDIKANIQFTKQQETLQNHLTDLEQKIGVTINDGLL